MHEKYEDPDHSEQTKEIVFVHFVRVPCMTAHIYLRVKN
jgi:hypothetical protein